jgi:transcription-repair coupling factor (superfamily II helicase)
MGLGVLGALLEAAPEFRRLVASLDKERVSARVQVISDATSFALATLSRSLPGPMLVVASGPEDARRLYDQVLLWSDDESRVLHFPESETLPFERIVADMDTTRQRIRTLSTLMAQHDAPLMLIASAAAVAQKTIARGTFESRSHTLEMGQRIDLDELVGLWRGMGYKVEPTVDVPGLVSRRGGILDIYPLGADAPARIELWGDEVDSIRLFDPETQRSTELVDSVTVIPAQETLPGLTGRDDLHGLLGKIDLTNCTDATRERIGEEIDLLLDGLEVEDMDFYAGFFNHGSLYDYLPDNALSVVLRPTEVAEADWDIEERSDDLRRVKERRGELPHNFPSSHFLAAETEQKGRRIKRRLEVLPWGAEDLAHNEHVVLPFASAPDFLGNLDRFVEEADELSRQGHRVVAVSSASKRLGEILQEYGVAAKLPGSLATPPEPGAITVLQSSGAGLGEGCVLTVNAKKLVVFSDSEIFGIAKQRRSVRRRAVKRDALLSELSPGDYVVHVEHGIGRFVGTGRNAKNEGEGEYLILQYAAGDQLYVPMDHLERVTPYVAPMDRRPSLTRLGSQEWKRTKERVERSTREMAAELLSLYASRELTEGFAQAPDTPWQSELEGSFPYEETPDQTKTVVEVKADMETARPMDRLVCGDVGYGKTEIALRAAFKTVMNGRQVAVLVPTTVLAQQHYVTFTERLKAYPVKIDVLSRFRTNLEQQRVVEGLADGKVDICIGTHRIIQKDVSFQKLGLVIVDEEQRFGVAHKERLKEMRNEVDVLTLTATPIPRTLHLSLAGIRDMSTIETPPEERLPIKTYVSEFSDELIREAIHREIDRQGQVFFVHNRVYNIDYMAGYVRMLVPEAAVGVAHGQMSEHQLEDAMIAFSEGRTDVLVCTTIIESGLDIPNANALIINRADAFGLAQLYQLRGRVGRGGRRAYAYLLIPAHRSLSEVAEKRLKTMLAATELGAGFQIAMKDLEIRGAGNLLGSAQSGHIAAVGFDLYTRLLSDAVEALRAQRATGLARNGAEEGEPAEDEEAAADPDRSGPAAVDLEIPSSIPGDYIEDLPTRLEIYRRLGAVSAVEEIEAMEHELLDRFGPLPWQVQNLLYVVRLKLTAGKAGVKAVVREDSHIVLRLHDEVGGARNALQRLLGRDTAVGHMQIRLDLENLSDGWEAPLMSAIEKLAGFRERLGV